MRYFVMFLSISALSGCSFVQLTDAGANVDQLTAEAVSQCTQKGVVSTKTNAKVVFNRNRETVIEEITVLARNEAATLGANGIVPIGEPKNGGQQFRSYLCP
ncbi:MAG: DUF4156 domain-containing protein [Gammaproteobacteria bacterium]|jgi:hypothetical protein|nr:DUF4156 domain-containing protein [Gammaproteobacteria bacterium]